MISRLKTLITFKVTMNKPFLKWVGGKTQIIEQVMKLFPQHMDNYYEPFLGGGSVLIALLTKVKNEEIFVTEKIYASDINENLINLYINVQKSPQEVIDKVAEIMKEFLQCDTVKGNNKPSTFEQAKTSRESYYYWTRERFNLSSKTTVIAAARMLFLNKTCFRGIYREGPHGFNVPYGNYVNPLIDEEHIRNISQLIQNVVFVCCSFEEILKNIKVNDFVYLDPPYASDTDKNFVDYNAGGFNGHHSLFKMCKHFSNTHIKFLHSNANVDSVREAFPKDYFKIITITARRAINSKDPSMRAEEVLITNIQ